MALRISSDASIRFLVKANSMRMLAEPSCAVLSVSVTPVIDCNDFSSRLTISRSTVSGEAPGYGILTMMKGICTGILVDAQFFQRHQAQAHHRDDQHDRRDRPLDTEIG